MLNFQKIDGEIRAAIDDATKKCKADKEIGLDELSADIYSLNIEQKVRNIDPFSHLVHKRIGPAVNFK